MDDNILTRQRGPGKHRSKERLAAETGQMSDEQFEFVKAVEQYKQNTGRRFVSTTEHLAIAKALGYSKQ